ncbi:hypothetical protein SAMN04515665_106120 [Blastococcus sp. DSM 46786]|uniref:hypothetical protein n=1 Tax=Blastococcus sp. DSM 46786 TaxID=1798227 RepID=UPI0008BD4D54|nr:hypothetical protein [Blastococcus sp. DSM 46786]SEK91628.1 hypothetical protein SAMN04515665_106120 [Blastococcus sp. DSM 46786]
MTTGMPAPWFVSEGASAEMIGSGEPRLRHYRGGDGSWSTSAAAFLRRLRPATTRLPVLGR